MQEVVDARSRSRGGLSRLEHRIALATALPLLAIAAVLPFARRPPVDPVDVPLVDRVRRRAGRAVDDRAGDRQRLGRADPGRVRPADLRGAARADPGADDRRVPARARCSTSGRSARALLLSVASCWFAVGPALLLLATGEVSGGRMVAVGLLALARADGVRHRELGDRRPRGGRAAAEVPAGRVGLLPRRQPDAAGAGRRAGRRRRAVRVAAAGGGGRRAADVPRRADGPDHVAGRRSPRRIAAPRCCSGR